MWCLQSTLKNYFKPDSRIKSGDSGHGRDPVGIRQLAVSEVVDLRVTIFLDKMLMKYRGNRNQKSWGSNCVPLCFVCNGFSLRHVLANCDKFKVLRKDNKKKIVLNASRCLNCLALGHFVRDCPLDCKCTGCRTKSMNKHTSALHELFSKKCNGFGTVTTANKDAVYSENVNSEPLISRKMVPNGGRILLRTSAVRIINRTTGESTLTYAPHDTATQATLV